MKLNPKPRTAFRMSAGVLAVLPMRVNAPIDNANPNTRSERVSMRSGNRPCGFSRQQVSFNQNGSAACFIGPESHGEHLKVYFHGLQHDSDANPLLAPSDRCVGPHLGNRNAGESSSRDKTTYFLVGGSRNNHRPLDSLARHPQTAGIGT